MNTISSSTFEFSAHVVILSPKNIEPEKKNRNRIALSIKLNLESRLINLSDFQE